MVTTDESEEGEDEDLNEIAVTTRPVPAPLPRRPLGTKTPSTPTGVKGRQTPTPTRGKQTGDFTTFNNFIEC